MDVHSALPAPLMLCGHEARFSSDGELAPWTSWPDALAREMAFYRECPIEHGLPRFVYETFLDQTWQPIESRTDTIPAMQNGMGILSYLGYHELFGTTPNSPAACAASPELRMARAMGDYLVRETLTPDGAAYPKFTRSTGRRAQFPLAPDCGAQSDRAYEIEPDKGGIAGYALARLFDVTHEPRYQAQALHNARILAAHQSIGSALASPWPFRVDYRSGAGRGAISGNMSYILRLYDRLIEQGFGEFREPRRSLWDWMRVFQIPSAATNGELFAQFFEDHDTETNRTAWAPLNLARYLLEQRARLDSAWSEHCAVLLDFVRRTFTHTENGIRVCHEQDEDLQAWNGINSTYGAVLACYVRSQREAGMTELELASEARQALHFTLYSIDALGRPRDLFKNAVPGGWQQDAHTDVIHNYIDAWRAFPEWGAAPAANQRDSPNSV